MKLLILFSLVACGAAQIGGLNLPIVGPLLNPTTPSTSPTLSPDDVDPDKLVESLQQILDRGVQKIITKCINPTSFSLIAQIQEIPYQIAVLKTLRLDCGFDPVCSLGTIYSVLNDVSSSLEKLDLPHVLGGSASCVRKELQDVNAELRSVLQTVNN